MRTYGYLFCFSLLSSTFAYSASVEKAELLSDHGLKAQAKSELIDAIFSGSSNDSKAHAYYTLGNLAFEENNTSIALDSWRTLIGDYPNSQYAAAVKDRIEKLAEIVGESVRETVNNAVAASYLKHANFWSKDRSTIFRVDSSWTPNIEAALKWYDKVIKEYPGTVASKVAYQDKMRTTPGGEKRGKYGLSHGIKDDFNKYMPMMLDTFAAFEAEHPDASSMQAFRYQIAQAYWSQKDWGKTREWLNLIIAKAGEGDSFYKDLAQRRMNKVEF